MTAQLEAKMDAKLATRTVGQLKEMVRMLWSDKTPEAAIVRGRIWNRLAELIGEDAADEVFEAK